MTPFWLPKTGLFDRTYGLLTVIAYAGRRSYRVKKKEQQWLCRCQCGKYSVVTIGNLRDGNTRSCGCTKIKHRHTAGPKKSSEYRAYLSMKDRCCRPENHAYSQYGGRGICVCDRWLDSFQNFIADMGPKPDPSYSLDRKENNGNYEPGNCRWATRTEQARNTRRSQNLTLGAETLSLTAWSKKSGLDKKTITKRLAKGMSVAEALTAPVRQRRA